MQLSREDTVGESNGYSLFRTTQTVIFGSGSLETLPDQVKFLGGRKAFIATDPGIEKAEILGQAEQLLSGAGIEFESYTKVEPEPPTTSIDACADAIARSGGRGRHRTGRRKLDGYLADSRLRRNQWAQGGADARN